jgi:hypothetical protein
MRVYTDEQLEGKKPEDFKRMLNQVKTSNELSIEEKTANIEKLESHLRVIRIRSDAMKDILEAQADYNDIIG